MPKIVDKVARRSQIADALLDIVAESGVASVTIRNVSERSGWSTGVVSHYFGNRQKLLMGGLRRAAELLGERHTGILHNLNGRQALEAMLEQALPIDSYRYALNKIFFYFFNEANHDQELHAEIEGYLTAWRRVAMRLVTEAQELGEIDSNLDPQQVARDLTCFVDGLAIHALLNEEIAEQLRETSPVRLWINRIAPKEPRVMAKFGNARRK